MFVTSLAASAYTYLVSWSHVPVGERLGPRGALLVNGALFTAFASHHSLFARDWIKSRLTRYVPDRLLRSFYVWVASLLWLAVIAGWQPLGSVVFSRSGVAALVHAAVQLIGVWLIWQSVRAIDPLELAGIRTGTAAAGLQVRGPYYFVRHPLYLGWLLIVFGAATMTGDRLAFAAMTSSYLVVAIPWEERALERTFGDDYRRYQARVRWRLLPFIY